MRREKKQTDRKRHTDLFTISGGALGPVPVCELQIRPFTVFVGAQGTGKSLVAQTLYAFEELPSLMAYVSTRRGTARRDSVELFRSILDQLRSSERRFGAFANPNVNISWQQASGDEWPVAGSSTPPGCFGRNRPGGLPGRGDGHAPIAARAGAPRHLTSPYLSLPACTFSR